MYDTIFEPSCILIPTKKFTRKNRLQDNVKSLPLPLRIFYISRFLRILFISQIVLGHETLKKYVSLYKILCKLLNKNLRYRPARLDLNESGIIGKPLKRTSTAICFWFFNLTIEYFKRLQSSEPLHAKLNPTSCLFGLRFAYLQAVIFFAFFLLVVRHWKTAGAPLFRFG